MRPFKREPRSNSMEPVLMSELMPQVVERLRERFVAIQLGTIKTSLPSEGELTDALSRAGLRRGCGAIESVESERAYCLAKEVLRFYWELSREDYDKAIDMICEYLDYY